MRTNDCNFKSCVCFSLLSFVFGQCLSQPTTNTPTLVTSVKSNTTTVSVEPSLGYTVGELLKRDAADALNPPAAKEASAALAAALIKPVVKGPDPFLTAVFGMEGARTIRLQLPDKPILTYVENERDTDKREPNWRLLAVEGRCAYFENFAPVSKKQKPVKAVQQKICYKRPQEIPRSLSVDPSGNPSAMTSFPLSRPLPSSMRP